MNFQRIPPVDNSKEILELAFRKAREKSKMKKLTGAWIHKIRVKEGIKLDVIKNVVMQRTTKMLEAFPSLNDLPEFYIALMRLTLDFNKFKRALGGLNWLQTQVRSLHRHYARLIPGAQDKEEANGYTREFYGRLSSLVKQIDGQFKFLEKCRKTMKSYPDIKDLFTVCIYGFPNVGKSTLLNTLTGTKAKTAAYAFTTVTINAGYIGEIQYLDVPGTLARRKKNFVELQAELVLKDLADVVIYVFDLTENCGFSLQDQVELYKKIGLDKTVLIYLSKQDIMAPEMLAAFPKKYYSVSELKEKISGLVPKVEVVEEDLEQDLK
ncbi:GTP-binding protein [Candidatus Woesearchaeota archaeon]|jgi:nucleolar GTP-binding protein|nr:GTP-binding protein [Candidatus Woesearchaeota archaeon]MBT5739547.1 GTP-binding protein [Candidatus Woesearchaeota archaeon]